MWERDFNQYRMRLVRGLDGQGGSFNSFLGIPFFSSLRLGYFVLARMRASLLNMSGLNHFRILQFMWWLPYQGAVTFEFLLQGKFAYDIREKRDSSDFQHSGAQSENFKTEPYLISHYKYRRCKLHKRNWIRHRCVFQQVWFNLVLKYQYSHGGRRVKISKGTAYRWMKMLRTDQKMK